jgi:hypothetical protein
MLSVARVLSTSVCLVIFPAVANAADEPAGTGTTVIGDIRGGFFGSRTENRNTAVTQVRDVRARVRIGLENAFNKEWRGTVRFAGHYSEEEASRRFSLHTYNDSRAFGQSTLDIANVEYLPNTRWNITAGRMQTKFELEGVAKKSLDRNDSPNIDIDFTDGLRAVRKADGGWHWTGIVQHNPVRGSTNVTRLPLNFSDSGARQTLFLAAENKQASGAFVQRGIDLTVIPDALLVTGATSGPREDYYAWVGRAALRWPEVNSGMRFLLGVELGYAPNTPQQSALRLGDSERADGTAWQTSFNLLDLKPGHSIGVVLGRADSGWLVSPDFRENERLAEIRYQWKLNKSLSLEARLRERVEIDKQTTAIQQREETDYYVRLTYKLN